MTPRTAALVLVVTALAGCDLGDGGEEALGPHLVAEVELDEHGESVLTDVRFPFGEAAGHLVGFCVAEPEGDDPYVACTTFANADGRGAEAIEFHGATEPREIDLNDWETPACGPAVRWARAWLEDRLG